MSGNWVDGFIKGFDAVMLLMIFVQLLNIKAKL